MNATDPLASFTNFLFSLYGGLTVLGVLCLFAFLWSDQIKRRWYDRIERKKWEQWNGPRSGKSPKLRSRDEEENREEEK
jgi:hypothetical protein